ncbi:MAG: Epimerase [Acidimicrobiia bacterium]|nr:Epimerase [Acidimicrobiia bacterium]
MDVVISGSSGLIGTALIDRLRSHGHRVVRLVRREAGTDELSWDPAAGGIDAAGLEGVDAVVHLSGAGIADHRWTDAYKGEVLSSRTRSTSLLAATLAKLQRPAKVLLSGSAIGYYGNRSNESLTEASAAGSGFLPDVCRQWEAAAAPAVEAGIRTAFLRTGIVLSADGGALAKQLPLFRYGLGGKFGRGQQWQSWIAMADYVAAIEHLLTADVAGPVNLTAPNPVTNAEFTATLGHVLHRPAVLPIPKFGPSLLLGRELTQALLYDSARVFPNALTDSGFVWSLPLLDDALHSILGHDHPHDHPHDHDHPHEH